MLPSVQHSKREAELITLRSINSAKVAKERKVKANGSPKDRQSLGSLTANNADFEGSLPLAERAFLAAEGF